MEVTDEQPKVCPQCTQVLEQGNGMLFAAMISFEGYICRRCQVVYAHDLKPLARLVGGGGGT